MPRKAPFLDFLVSLLDSNSSPPGRGCCNLPVSVILSRPNGERSGGGCGESGTPLLPHTRPFLSRGTELDDPPLPVILLAPCYAWSGCPSFFPAWRSGSRGAPCKSFVMPPSTAHRNHRGFFLRLAILRYSGSAYFDVGIRKSLRWLRSRRLLSYTNFHLFAPYPILTKFEVYNFISLSFYFFFLLRSSFRCPASFCDLSRNVNRTMDCVLWIIPPNGYTYIFNFFRLEFRRKFIVGMRGIVSGIEFLNSRRLLVIFLTSDRR